MQNLADIVVDYFVFLCRKEEHELDSELAVKLLELFHQIENKFTDVEKQQVQEAALRRLRQQEQQIANDEYVPHFPTEVDESSVLRKIAYDWFDMIGGEDILDPDEIYDE